MIPSLPDPATRVPGLLLALTCSVLLLAGCGSSRTTGTDTAGTGTAAASAPVRVVAVGDVVCPPGEPTTPVTCQQEATADLTSDLDPDVVLGLGDLQYETGSPDAFREAWAATWGRFDDVVEPVPGNHEYGTPDAAGYTGYFGPDDAAVPRVRELGAWRVYLLDSSCDEVDCEAEASWLAGDLAAHPEPCTAIAMHHPRWSSGAHGPEVAVAPLWDAAVAGGVDLSLSAHDHDYERFAPMDQNGDEDPAGVRHFVVGTGGKSFYDMRETIRSESRKVVTDHFGVLDLDLTDGGYSWRFVDVDGETLDEGSATC